MWIRKGNTFGLEIAFTPVETRDVALGRVWHQKTTSLCEVFGLLWKAEVMWEEPLTLLLCN